MLRYTRSVGLIVGCCLFATCARVFAEAPEMIGHGDEPEPQSFLVWVIQCLGLYGMLAVLAAVLLFFGSWLVVIVARRPAVIASYLVFLILPLLLAVTGALKALVGAFSVIA